MKNLIILTLLIGIFGCSHPKHGYEYKTGSTCRNPHKRHEVKNFTRIR